MARIQTPQHVQELQAEFKVREPFGLELLETIQPTYSLGRQKIASTGYPRDAMGRMGVTAGGVGTNAQAVVQGRGGRGVVYLYQRAIIIKPTDGIVEIRASIGATISVTEALSKTFLDQRIAVTPPRHPERILYPAHRLH